MKKLYLILLMLLLMFIPTSHAVAVYQLDQPIAELNGYTLREVFTNRNLAMPDLTGKTEISSGVYRLQSQNDGHLDYDILTGHYRIHGLFTGPLSYNFGIRPTGDHYAQIWEVNKVDYDGTVIVFLGGGNLSQVSISNTISYDGKLPAYNSNYLITLYRANWSGGANVDVTFKVQFEKGSTATPYQVPTNGPYSDIDVGQFNLTSQQIQTYYDLYLEAVRFEQENIDASKDEGGYQNIFNSIVNGVKTLMQEMGYVWQWLNAPLITSDMQNFSINIDWSWDLLGVIRQILNGAGILTLQILFIVPSLAFAFMGIPVQISVLSLLFSNLIFLLLGWIMVKSFLI